MYIARFLLATTVLTISCRKALPKREFLASTSIRNTDCIETQQVKRTDSYPNADSVTHVYDRQDLMMHGRDAVKPLKAACKDQPPELKKEFD